MRQSIGGSWLIGIMVLFIMIFAGYIILTIDYNKSVKVKNESISLIEKYEGLNEQSLTLLNNYLLGSGYTTTGKCGGQNYTQGGMYGAVDLERPELEETDENQNYYYCIKKYKGANTSYYYQITLFYRFNLPVFGDTSRFTIKGSTANFQAKDDPKYAVAIGGGRGGIVDDGNNNSGPSSYTVKFRTNATNVIVPNQTVSPGSKASRPADPERKGYTFSGWYLNGNLYDFNTPVNSSIVLIANWEKKESVKPNVKEFKIFFDFNGGLWGGIYSSMNDTGKQNSTKRFDGMWSSVTNSGCSLDYFIDQDGNKYYRSNASFKVTKDMTLKAMWSGSCSYDPNPPTSDMITIKIDLGYKNAPSLESLQIPKGSKVPKPANPSLKGYVFKGWTKDYSGGYYKFDMEENRDFTLRANWYHVIVDYFKNNAPKIIKPTYCYGCNYCFYGKDPFYGTYGHNNKPPADYESVVCDAFVRDNPGIYSKSECLSELNTDDITYGQYGTSVKALLGVSSKCEPGQICYSTCSQ